MDPPADAIVLEPVAVARPLLDQRLVRDLDLTFVDGQQARRDECVDDALRAVDSEEIVERHATTDERSVLSACEPQHDAARDLLVGGGELLEGLLGEARNRAAHATHRPVGVVPQRTAVACGPELEQCGLEQRQRAGCTGRVGDERIDEPALHLEPRPAAGTSIARANSSRSSERTNTWLWLSRSASRDGRRSARRSPRGP